MRIMNLRTTDWSPIILCGAGFLLSVLWFDLKFDLLAFDAWRNNAAPAPENLASIKQYYQQALSSEQAGFPLIITMMGITVVGLVLQLFSQVPPLWVKVSSLVLGVVPIGLAGVRVVPMANELVSTDATYEVQAVMAMNILVDHLVCFGCVGGLIGVQVWQWVVRNP